MSRPPSRVSARRRWSFLVAAVALALAALFLAGCATFPDNGPREWREKPDDGGPLAAPPRIPDQESESERPPPPGQQGGTPMPDGCTDPDPQVVATCLSPLSSVIVQPDAETALVAERPTGRILRVHKDKDPQLVATIPVDPSGGGLIGLVLSPSYAEDQLLYALVASPSDRRVVRLVPGDPATPILTGIPRTGDDSGAIATGREGELLVATGGGGSLGGKLLRIDTFGHPFKGNPAPGSPVYSSGLYSPGGMCVAPDTGAIWVTDRAPGRDALHMIRPGPLPEPAWSWPDRPGVAGCVAPPGALVIAERSASALYLLHSNTPGTFTGTPQTVLAGVYGRIGPLALAPDGLIWLGTTNKGAGGPVVSSDDRAVRIHPPAGSGGSGPE